MKMSAEGQVQCTWLWSNVRPCFLSLFKTSGSFYNSWSLLTNCQAALRYTNPMYQKQLTGQPWITCTVDLATLFDQVTGPGFLKGRVLCFTFNTLFKKLILNMQYLALWPLNYLKGLERWLKYVCVYIMLITQAQKGSSNHTHSHI